ncbi:hypothetical protein HHI36_022199 [Cryptolaemus montrouzieri]|uniref:Uncharacterized protein n=1 Tax=Cryptolaemus montrouzieri TaxID=559131 RepID=A0ABD2MZ07_9CUCU
MEANKSKQDATFNKNRAERFAVGYLVLTRITSHPANRKSKKLLPKYRGPFKVIEVLPNDRYRVKEDIHTERSNRPYTGVAGVEHMKPFIIQQK